MILIDPPSPFAPTSEWRAFLDDMEEMRPAPEDEEAVAAHIDEARQMLDRREKGM